MMAEGIFYLLITVSSNKKKKNIPDLQLQELKQLDSWPAATSGSLSPEHVHFHLF